MLGEQNSPLQLIEADSLTRLYGGSCIGVLLIKRKRCNGFRLKSAFHLHFIVRRTAIKHFFWAGHPLYLSLFCGPIPHRSHDFVNLVRQQERRFFFQLGPPCSEDFIWSSLLLIALVNNRLNDPFPFIKTHGLSSHSPLKRLTAARIRMMVIERFPHFWKGNRCCRSGRCLCIG